MSEIADWSSEVTYHKGDRVRTMYGEATFDGEKFVLDVAGDTPRTDAATYRPDSIRIEGMRQSPIGEWVKADFARQLERENNDLRKLIEADKAFLASKGFTTLPELLEDKKRLDWLMSETGWLWRWQNQRVDIPCSRESIDAARKATPCPQ